MQTHFNIVSLQTTSTASPTTTTSASSTSPTTVTSTIITSTPSTSMPTTPQLTLTPSYIQINPNQIYRSALFSLSTSIYFACNSSYTNIYAWTLQNLDSGIMIDLSANPSLQSSTLVIQSNSLAYGLYKFTIQVDTVTSLYGTFTNTAQTYTQIIPTGLAVFGIANGISSQLIGSTQPFVLNPVAYSFDMDNLVVLSSLQFDFYCQTINVNQSTLLASSQLAMPSLKAYTTNSSLVLAKNVTCFGTLGISIFLNLV